MAHRLLMAGAVTLMSGLVGCASQNSTRSGFISDYSGLTPAGGSENAMKARILALAPDPSALSRFRAVYIEPVTVIAEDLDAEQRATITEELGQALQSEIAKSWSIVGRPDKDVLRVRVALTAVTKANVPLNVVLTGVAVPLSNGGAAGEAEVVDGRTRARVAALTWADEKRLSSPLGYYSQTGHARALLPEFATEVAKLIARGTNS